MSNFKEDLMNVKAFVFDIDGVLSTEVVSLDNNGEPIRSLNIKDAFAIQLAIKKGYQIAIISGGNSISSKLFQEKLGVTDIFLNSSDKLTVFNSWIKQHSLKPEEVMYMGDDLPDYSVMKITGVAVCPKDATEEIKSLCKYISHRKGGYGCVRDVIEQVLRAQYKWDKNQKW